MESSRAHTHLCEGPSAVDRSEHLWCLHRQRVSATIGPTRCRPHLRPPSTPPPTTVTWRMMMTMMMMVSLITRRKRPSETDSTSKLPLLLVPFQRARRSNQESLETEKVPETSEDWMCVSAGHSRLHHQLHKVSQEFISPAHLLGYFTSFYIIT